MNFENNEENNNEVLDNSTSINNSINNKLDSYFVARNSMHNDDAKIESIFKEDSIVNNDSEENIDTAVEENIVINNNNNNNNDNNLYDDSNSTATKVLRIIVIILIIVLIGGLGYFLYKQKSNNNGNTNDGTTVVDDNNSEESKTNNKKISDLGYNCKTGKCTMSAINENVVLINDGTDKVLYDDLQSKVLQTFGEEYSVEISNNALIVTDENGKKAYYDITLGKYITEFKYENFELLESNYLIASLFPYGNVTDGVYWLDENENIMSEYAIDVIKISDGSVLYHKEINDWENIDGEKPISISKMGIYNYYLEKNNGHFEILDLDFKLLLSIDSVKASYHINVPTPQILANETIFMNYGNKFVIYDLNGSEVYKSKEYKQFMEIVNTDIYSAVIENNKVKIIDLNEKVIAEFDNWNNNLTIVSALNFNDTIKSRYSNDEKTYDHKYTDQSIIYNGNDKKWDYLWNIYDKEKTECGINADGIYIKAINKNKSDSKAKIYYYNEETKEQKVYEAEDSCIDNQI